MQHVPEQAQLRSKPNPAQQHPHANSVRQYGVQTPNSNVVLMVTTDRAAAERALEWIDDGRIVERTIDYGEWSDRSEAR